MRRRCAEEDWLDTNGAVDRRKLRDTGDHHTRMPTPRAATTERTPWKKADDGEAIVLADTPAEPEQAGRGAVA